MKRFMLCVGAVALTVVGGCSKEEAGQQAAPESRMTESAGAPMSTREGGGTGDFPVIDHSQDEKEFELRKSLSGVESLIQDLEAQGEEVSDELRQRRAELEKQLQQLTQG